MKGEWLLRIEDIDPPREVAGASDEIIRTLEQFGFEWDAEISYQSQRSEYYLDALETLKGLGLLYPCACSRKEISKINSLGIYPGIYPGTCRMGLSKNREGREARSWRLLTEPVDVAFRDAIQGPQQFSMENEIGDFVLKRADGLFAYQLAVGIDDALQGITQVVRGSDLLDSTPRQLYLQQMLGQQMLGHPRPDYAHHPVVTDAQGEKLSKQKLAPALSPQDVVEQLYRALSFLGQQPPRTLLEADRDSLWQWAIENWSLAKIPRQMAISIEEIDKMTAIVG